MDYEKKYLKYKFKYLFLKTQTAGACNLTATYKNNNESGTYYGCMSGTLQKKRDGKGVMKYTNGNRFEGEWSNDKIKDGIGTMDLKHKYANSANYYTTTYVGEFRDGQLNGNGKMFDTPNNTSYYDGRWLNNQREGLGTMTNAEHYKYTGSWSDDQMTNGKMEYGTRSFPTKVHPILYWEFKERPVNIKPYASQLDRYGIYTGQWSDFVRHGKGKMVYDHTNGVEVYIPEVSDKLSYSVVSFDGIWNNDKWKTGNLIYNIKTKERSSISGSKRILDSNVQKSININR